MSALHQQSYSPRIERLTTGPSHKFLKSYTASWSTTGTIPTVTSYNFTLDNLSDYGRLSALYDQYRITRIEFSAVPLQNVSSGTQQLPAVMSILDYDGSGPTDISSLMEYRTLLLTQPGHSHYRSFVPCTLQPVYTGITASGYSPSLKPIWVDMAYGSVKFYGITIASNSLGTGTVNNFHIFVTYHFECRNSR